MITKKMTIGQAIRENPEAVPIFLKNGLGCVGCPMAGMETVEQGAMSHGLDVDKLVSELNGAGKNEGKEMAKKPVKKKEKTKK